MARGVRRERLAANASVVCRPVLKLPFLAPLDAWRFASERHRISEAIDGFSGLPIALHDH